MKETTRTLIFVAVAVVSVGLAYLTDYMAKPKPLEGFEKVGKPFYPDFVDSTEARSLRVVAFDDETLSLNKFEVVFSNNQWQIPTHFDYPVDAEDQLTETAASTIGIKRTKLASRREGDHERFGVVDPEKTDSASFKGRGTRLTLTGSGDTVLADYIIGKRAGDEAEDPHAGFSMGANEKKNTYYVRRPDEKETYRVELKINLSTKFSDWIDSNLLDVKSNELREIVIDRFSVQRKTGKLADRQTSKLSRDSDYGDWKLDGITEKTEEVDNNNVREIVNGLAKLEIIGVRPKPPVLLADMTIDPRALQDPRQAEAAYAQINQMMQPLGFDLRKLPDGGRKLVSKNGEISAKTSEGVVYALHFGETFLGDVKTIEIGAPADKKASDKKESKEESPKTDSQDATESSDDETGDEPDDNKNESKRGRYVFVVVNFDPSLLGPKIEKPVEPKLPEFPKPDPKPVQSDKALPKIPDQDKKKSPEGAGDKKGKTDEGSKKSTSKQDGRTPPADSLDDVKVEQKKDAKPGVKEEKKDVKPGVKEEKKEPKKEPQIDFAAAMKKFQEDQKSYQEKLKKFDEYTQNYDKGRKKVDRLNNRFKGWYYVISAETYESLRLDRKDLVKIKEKPEEKKPEEKKPEEKKSEEKKTEKSDDKAGAGPLPVKP